MDHADTLQLISEYLVGRQDAVERLVQNHQDEVYRLALSILDDPEAANEVAQDALISAMNNLDSYQHFSTFKAWLYTITINACRSHLRKARAVAKLNHALQIIFRVQSQSAASTEEQVIRNEKDAALWKAIRQLNDKHRIPLILRYFNDLSIAEIAQIMNINEGTIHSRLHIAREQLRLVLEKEID